MEEEYPTRDQTQSVCWRCMLFLMAVLTSMCVSLQLVVPCDDGVCACVPCHVLTTYVHVSMCSQ